MHDDGDLAALRLLPPRPHPPLPEPDTDARAALARAANGDNLVVLGAPGTGKTSLALRLVVEAVASGRQALLLAPTRARADVMRQRAAHLLREAGAGGGAPRVRTPAGLAFTILSTSLTRRPDPLPAPVLLAGAEEDAALAALIRPEQWPGLPAEAVTSRAFRSELRNLLARAGELGVDAETLADLGRALDVPVWGPAAALLRLWDAQGRPTADRRAATRRMDTARIQDRAVEALGTWEADAVAEPRPVPDLVVVDDYQDCTAATARLLTALATPDAAGHRSQVIVLGNPDVAVETFRGGAPSLLIEAEDRSGLAARRLTLGRSHRGSPELAAVWSAQAARIPVTGTATHRRPAPAGTAGAEEPTGSAPSGVEPLVAASDVQETAHVARILRAEHVHHHTPWERMAVIVRSAGRLQAVTRELRRRGVPLATSTPAVLLRSEPAAAALLDVARAALEGRLGTGSTPPERAPVLDLLSSPLVGMSALDLRRLRRRLRAEHTAASGSADPLQEALATPAAAKAIADELVGEPLARQADALARAARIIAALREASGDAPPSSGAHPHPAGAIGPQEPSPGAPRPTDDQTPPTDVEALLWSAWHASGCAQRWRELALGKPPGPGERPDPLLAQAAEKDLDVVTTLFKRAEVWSERNPGSDASVFLAELAEEVLPSDSVAPQGQRQPGVSVLTPAAAAGNQWEVVAVMGLNRDAWPDLRLRDTITRSGLLVDAVMGRLPVDGAGRPTAASDPVSARAQVRADERRMLLAALSRATRRLLVTAVADEESAPSSFFIEIAQTVGFRVTDADGVPLTAPDVGDLTLRGLVGELRHAAVSGHLPGASRDERRRSHEATAILAELAAAGIPGADPQDWAGPAEPTSSAPLVEEGEPVRVSPSDVESLTTCPLQWFLRRQGGSSGPSGAQNLGVLIHALAEEAQREDLRGPALAARLEERLPELAYPDTWLGGLAAQRARDMVARLDSYLTGVPGRVDVEQGIDVLLHLPRPDREPGAPGPLYEGDAADSAAGSRSGSCDPGPEPTPDTGQEAGPDAGDLRDAALGAAETSVTVRLRGRIDRVEHLSGAPAPAGRADGSLPEGNGARVRLIDLKTGASRPTDSEHHPQLAAYRLALEATGYEVTGAALVMLGAEPSKRTGETVVVPPGAVLAPSPDPETGQDWAADLVASAALDASGPHLQARTGTHCQRCELKDSCPATPEGRRAFR